MRLILVILLLIFPSTFSSFSDLPYEEIISTRRPFQNTWPPDQLPTNWSSLPCSSIISSQSTMSVGALILCSDLTGSSIELYSLSLDSPLSWTGSPQPSSSLLSRASLSSTITGEILFLLIPGDSILYSLDCNAQQLSCNVTSLTLPLSLPAPVINSTAVYTSTTSPSSTTLWACSNSLIVAFDINLITSEAQLLPGLPYPFGASAIAHSVLLQEIALGNDTKVVFINAANPEKGLLYWEWVTDIVNGDGGVYDDVITSLVYDDLSQTSVGTLYIGTPCCLNVRSPLGVVSRIAAHEGLPVGNITSLSMNYNGPSPRLWIGSTQGLSLFDPSSPSQYGLQKSQFSSFSSSTAPSPPLQQRFRYFYGPRWLPALSPTDPFAGSSVSSILTSTTSDTAFVITSGGVSVLEMLNMTLLDKVRIYESTISRHSRLQQISQCNFQFFGRVEGCISGTDDNDGLWTSLTVIGESMRLLLTGETAAKDLVAQHFGGMYLLMRATGIKGLISRSVVCPGCDTGGGGVWHNSTVPGLENFLWKGDASSDEVIGHTLAYPFVVQALGASDPVNASLAKNALLDLARYIINNGFRLIDITGQPTTWGHFEPSVLNFNRTDWCDTRGLNSLEILGLITGGLSLTDTSDPDHILFAQALSTLRLAGYFRNIVNLKIEAPSDDNYSDDELTMFAYLSFAFTARGLPEVTQDDWKLFNLSLSKTFNALRHERSAIWNSFFSLCGIPLDTFSQADVLWNLRTWQLESTSWPVRNSHRLDIIPDMQNSGRSEVFNDALYVLPANERAQGRWNSDPFDLDGGSGMSEDDPGAFILSYWAARFAGILE